MGKVRWLSVRFSFATGESGKSRKPDAPAPQSDDGSGDPYVPVDKKRSMIYLLPGTLVEKQVQLHGSQEADSLREIKANLLYFLWPPTDFAHCRGKVRLTSISIQDFEERRAEPGDVHCGILSSSPRKDTSNV